MYRGFSLPALDSGDTGLPRFLLPRRPAPEGNGGSSPRQNRPVLARKPRPSLARTCLVGSNANTCDATVLEPGGPEPRPPPGILFAALSVSGPAHAVDPHAPPPPPVHSAHPGRPPSHTLRPAFQ